MGALLVSPLCQLGTCMYPTASRRPVLLFSHFPFHFPCVFLRWAKHAGRWPPGTDLWLTHTAFITLLLFNPTRSSIHNFYSCPIYSRLQRHPCFEVTVWDRRNSDEKLCLIFLLMLNLLCKIQGIDRGGRLRSGHNSPEMTNKSKRAETEIRYSDTLHLLNISVKTVCSDWWKPQESNIQLWLEID